MTRINTNIGALRGLRNVAQSNKALQTSLQRLSTGLKINNGADNPSGLIAGESLRLQITSIEQSVKNSNRANNVISTADSALGEISGLLNQVRGLVQEALNVGALSEDEVQANQSQVDAALSAIDRISSNTSFAGDKLLDGSKAFITNLSTTDAAKLSDFQVNEAIFGTQSSIALNARVTTAAEKGELRYNGGTLSTATTIEVAGSNGNQVLYLGGSSTVGNIRDAINAVADATGVAATLKAGVQVGGGTPVAAVAATLSAQSSSAVTAVAATRTATTVTASAAVAASRTFNAAAGGTGTVTVAADTAGTGGNAIQVVFADPGANSSALSASLSGNVITVNLATDAGGLLDATANTADLVRDAINGIAGKTFTATSNNGTGGFAAAAAANLTGGAAAVAQEQITFTADTANAAGNSINVSITSGGSNAVSVSGNNVTITRAAGTTTAQLVSFLNTDSSAGAVAFQALATASGAGTTAINANVAAGTLSGGVDAAAADNITFTADTAGFAGNNLSVSIASGGSNSVSVSGNNITITRAAGTTTAQLVNFLNTD
ncbi:MAG TPA: hypothetical protein VFG20_06415, partial [Planctomycetaceae bacterium]|nr:hypothetical protein [Planctomycetaceae bacterium]